jgi:HTH-type transcriptional regulator/antitoxin HigA
MTINEREGHMTDFVPAEAFPPGEFLKDELDERGWTQDEFAKMIRVAPKVISEIISNKRGIAPETAIRISAGLGTSAQLWMNLDTAYRLYRLHRSDAAPEGIAQERRLRETYPVRELIKRGWVKDTEDNPELLESRVLRFYGVKNIDDAPTLAYAARQTGSPATLTPIQEAWLYRVKQVAEEIHVRPYSKRLLRDALPRLSALRSAPEEARHVPRLLAECGVRYVIVEPVTGSRIDGVCLWLAPDKPVIGMSLRIDRIDNFWFVLRHEVEHVLRGDGKAAAIIDSELGDVAPAEGSEISPEESAADRAAEDFCVPKAEMDNFIGRVGAAPSEERIVRFAERLGVHPGLVVGQLQWRLKRYNLLRKYLVKVKEVVKVRSIVTPGAMTDGYGRQLLDAAE